MPAATTASDLIAVTVVEFEKLIRLISDMPDVQAMTKREGNTSIKDVIAHRAHWIDLFLGWYADGQADNNVDFPAKGYKWNDLKHYNAVLRAQQAGLTWDDARASLSDRHRALLLFIQTTPALYDGPMKGANNTWTTGRWAEAAGASHYRSAAKRIRTCLRSDAKKAL